MCWFQRKNSTAHWRQIDNLFGGVDLNRKWGLCNYEGRCQIKNVLILAANRTRPIKTLWNDDVWTSAFLRNGKRAVAKGKGGAAPSSSGFSGIRVSLILANKTRVRETTPPQKNGKLVKRCRQQCSLDTSAEDLGSCRDTRHEQRQRKKERKKRKKERRPTKKEQRLFHFPFLELETPQGE